jgi:glutamate racemase
MVLNRAIGIFDSGVGGLSVLREIRALLPNETLYYVADSGFAPYGTRSAAYIQERCDLIVKFLLARQVKAIVIACNTATAVAVDHLRSWCPVPIIAMEPAIKPARLYSKTAKIGVLATKQTLASNKIQQLILAHGQGVELLLTPCCGFVELVEQGQQHSAQAKQLIERYVSPLLAQAVDTLVLGCTHYPFLSDSIREVAGASVTLIDPSPAVAKELLRQLTLHHLRSERTTPADMYFWSSAIDLIQVAQMISQLLPPTWATNKPLMVHALD